jgi:hypothetical protein
MELPFFYCLIGEEEGPRTADVERAICDWKARAATLLSTLSETDRLDVITMVESQARLMASTVMRGGHAGDEVTASLKNSIMTCKLVIQSRART